MSVLSPFKGLPSLKLTWHMKNRPSQKEIASSNHQFLGAILVSRRVITPFFGTMRGPSLTTMQAEILRGDSFPWTLRLHYRSSAMRASNPGKAHRNLHWKYAWKLWNYTNIDMFESTQSKYVLVVFPGGSSGFTEILPLPV